MQLDRLFPLVIGVVAAAAVPQQATTPPAATGIERPSLSGRWRFDATQSDDSKQKMQDAMAAHRGSGGGGREGGGHMGGGGGSWGGHHGGGGGGGWHGGGGGRGPEGGGRPPGDHGSMSDFFDVPEELAVTQTANEIAIMEKDGRLRTLHPDGHSYKSESGTSEVKTSWDGAQLLVETKPREGTKLTETFTTSGNPASLVVNLRLESSFLGTVNVRRVYQPVADGQ